MTINLKRLSRTMAHALRHDPQHYHLELDSGGWVDLSVLVAALRENIRAFAALTEHDIKDAVAASAKPRYEIMEGRIRARYGHSTPEKIPQSPATPPDILYHGTNSHALSLILKDGLKAMQRQYVHFAVEAGMAHEVGSRHAGETIILKIRAREAHDNGIVFYKSHDSIWLADSLPPEYIEV